MDKEGKCCFCGKDYFEYGFSTWGCWTFEEEKKGMGEEKRCCAECNEKTVVPARQKKADAMKQGIISSVKEDVPAVFFEATSRNATTFEGCSHRFFEDGLYQIITYEKADSMENSETKIQNIGKKIEAVKKVKELFRFGTGGFSLEPYLNDYEEVKLDNPYDESEISYVKFGDIIYSGKSLFTIFNDEEMKKRNIDLKNKDGRRYDKVRMISRLKSETVILLRQLFGIEEQK